MPFFQENGGIYKIGAFEQELLMWKFQEKGQGSAIDMAKRNTVRQISEREVGILDMICAYSATIRK